MINVHILTIPGREQWLSECLQSFKDDPVNVFVVPGIVGNFPESRKQGYLEGTAAWVTYVDDDDRVTEGAFRKIVEAMDNHKEAEFFYSYEEAIDEAGNVIKTSMKQPHHLIIYPRKHIEENADVFTYKNPDYELLKRIPKTAKVFCIESVGYQWRQHSKSHSKEVVQ